MVILGFVLLITVGFVPAAFAAYAEFKEPVTGFFSDTSLEAPAFAAALSTAPGDATIHLDFNADKNGAVYPAFSQVNGDIFSNDVTFSTRASAAFGGVNSPKVNYIGDPVQSQIGPLGTYDGILVIDFAASGKLATGVGFGTVELDGNAHELIRAYDQSGTLIDTFSPLDAPFDFWGLVGNGASRISRVELEGGFYAIQDISYRVAPEPRQIAALMLGLGFMTGVLLRRRSMSKMAAR